MTLLFFNEVINSDLAAAVAWTLLHSTWQGMLAAIISGLIVVFTKKQTAALRYRLYTAVFLLFLVSVTFTFVLQYNDQVNTTRTHVPQPSTHENTAAAKISANQVVMTGMSKLNSLARQTDQLLHRYYPFLFSIWLLGFAFKFCYMLTGFRFLNRLRREALSPADVHWQNLVNRLSSSLGIQRQVLLLESARIKVPMMTGILKPVILVPLGLCCHLPPAEMEAILLHELAHIRRSDYVMNLVQRLMETIFFFNPCLLWISSLMRDERENCCDDMAVEVIRNKEQYVHALVAFQEFNLACHETQALAFAGSRQRLLYRVKRLLINENKKLNHMEKMILVCSMVVLTAAFSISSGNLQAQERNKPLRESQRRESAESQNRNRDRDVNEENRFEHLSTINSSNNGRQTTTITATDSYGKKYVLRKTDGRVTRLVIDNKEIDENDFPEYREIIEKIESGNAKGRISQRNNNNDDNDTEREMLLSREADLLAKQRRAMEADLQRQHRQLENRRNEIDDDLNVEEERAALRMRKQRDNGMDDDARRELKELQLLKKFEKDRIKHEQHTMELHRRLDKEKQMQGQHEMELHQQREKVRMMQGQQEMKLQRRIAQERLREDQQMQMENKKMMLERLHHEQQKAREHQQKLIEEHLEAEAHNRAFNDQRRKLAMEKPENLRNLNNNRKRNELKDDELADLDHERIAEERQMQIERKMEQRERLWEAQQDKMRNKKPSLKKINSNNEISSILQTLEEEGVIDNTERVSFMLNDEELIVNGRRQPDALHETLKEKYIHNRGDAFIYEKNRNSTKTTINRN